MYWTALLVAGLFEMLGVLGINFINKYKNWKSIAFMIIMFSISFVLLSYSMNEITMSVAYAIWTGIGAAGSAIMGIIFFKEPATRLRILFIFCIISATIGLKLIT
ncbi:DMT family transporter [Alkalibacillus haloalkaliphilus]|uniref:QacE family quaternary ammonium compound efflux SMR transporter n=1 Tax=Alkalibacillus haloalkaliphilus TaxID=94136 RepID=A0A511W4U7_9BACI|nr:multidrug efflux SMR transporter [Alkalibacillus haloalkaliphilus]GEN44392.1 QacE family quaternary ammonium compound efflux SMR transporter [Alkalibacillus haloalkaliphilus]